MECSYSSITNGVIPVAVTIVDALSTAVAKHYDYTLSLSWDDWYIEVGLRNCNNSNNKKNDWKTFLMGVAWMHVKGDHDIFHIRLPIFITSYKIDMRLRLTYNEKCFNVWSDVQSIEISSILVHDDIHEIGDKIKVTHPDIKVLSSHKATIIGKVIKLGNGEIKTITNKDEGLQKEKEKETEKENEKQEMIKQNNESKESKASQDDELVKNGSVIHYIILLNWTEGMKILIIVTVKIILLKFLVHK